MAVVNNFDIDPATNLFLNTQSNFTIVLKNGVGVQVAARNNVLETYITIPSTLKVSILERNIHYYSKYI